MGLTTSAAAYERLHELLTSAGFVFCTNPQGLEAGVQANTSFHRGFCILPDEPAGVQSGRGRPVEGGMIWADRFVIELGHELAELEALPLPYAKVLKDEHILMSLLSAHFEGLYFIDRHTRRRVSQGAYHISSIELRMVLPLDLRPPAP